MKDSFCYQPWNGLFVNHDGNLRPCCKYRPELDPLSEAINIKEPNAIERFQNSHYIKNLQMRFQLEQKPKGCVLCWKDEDAGYPSQRQLHNERWQAEFERYDLDSQKLNLLSIPIGNLCNLKCRICSPVNSSKWIKEWKDLYGQTFEKNDWANDPEIWKDLVKHSKDMLEIHIHGGEPFLLDNDIHMQFLESLVSTGADQVRIHYSTNATTFPSKSVRSIWKKFKHVDVQPSIDDIGKRFEYNRKGADWSDVEENLLKYYAMAAPNFQLSIACTVSIFTINYLDEIFNYYYQNNLPMPWLGRLHNPDQYRCSVLPTVARCRLQQKLENSQWQDVRSVSKWLNDNHSHLLNKFKTITAMHDKYRNEKFEDVFPELVDMLEF